MSSTLSSSNLYLLVVSLLLGFPVLFFTYAHFNDKRLRRLPYDASKHSPKRWDARDARAGDEKFKEKGVDIMSSLPPKTERRYIVVGGAGFLGGWIVLHLLRRGEDPKKIRILDIRAPSRHDLQTGQAKEVQFIKCDVSDAHSVHEAFSTPWPSNSATPITIFHTAANIRFYERHRSLLSLSSNVNVQGTQNVIDAARKIGATAMVYTSSASVSVRRSRFWLWPWESEPKFFVQKPGDNDSEGIFPKTHYQFFSNYAVTKHAAETLVRQADLSPVQKGDKKLRTGCIKPGNGVFGPGGDTLCGAYLVRKMNPSWIGQSLQNFTYVENCSIAHLCYEQRLIELDNNEKGIGGDSFLVTDPSPPQTYQDVYDVLTELTDQETQFPEYSPTLMLGVAHIVELFYLSRHLLLSAPQPFRFFARFVPPVKGDIVNLQPSLFPLVNVHLIFDDSRARKLLGYKGPFSTMDGLCKTVQAHRELEAIEAEMERKGLGGQDRAKMAGVSFGFGMIRAQRGVEKVVEKVAVDGSVPN